MRIEEVGQCAGETGQLTEEAGQQAGEAAWTLAGEARKRTKEAEHIEQLFAGQESLNKEKSRLENGM